MIISIAILLLARRVFSSLPIQGSISTFNKDSISLYVNKLNTNDLDANLLSEDNLNKLFAKLREALLKGQIHLIIDIGGKVIDIQQKIVKVNDRSDDKRDYLEMDYSNDFDNNFSINAVKFKHINMMNYLINIKTLMLKEMVDNISNLLWQMALIQKYNQKKNIIKNRKLEKLFHIEATSEKLFHIEDLYPESLPQNSMNLNQIIAQFRILRTLFSDKFVLNEERWDLKNELKIFFEYIKSVQDSLWLNRLLDVKRYELNLVFDDIIRWKFLNLQKQAQYLLENLIEKEKQSKKMKNKKIFPKNKNTSIISNIKNIKSEKAMTLNKKDKGKLNKTEKTILSTKKMKASFNEIYNKTQIMDKNITRKNQISPKVEMRIFSYSKLLKNINGSKSKHKDFAIKADPANKEITVKKFARTSAENSIVNDNSTYIQKEQKTFRDENVTIKTNSIDKQIFSKTKPTKMFNDKTRITTKLKNRFNYFNQKNVSTILANKSIKNTLKKNDYQKQARTSSTLHGFLRENIMNISTSFSLAAKKRKILQTLISRNKNETQKQKAPHYTSEKNDLNNNHNFHIKQKNASMIDEILEAIHGILPTRNVKFKKISN